MTPYTFCAIVDGDCRYMSFYSGTLYMTHYAKDPNNWHITIVMNAERLSFSVDKIDGDRLFCGAVSIKSLIDKAEKIATNFNSRSEREYRYIDTEEAQTILEQIKRR